MTTYTGTLTDTATFTSAPAPTIGTTLTQAATVAGSLTPTQRIVRRLVDGVRVPQVLAPHTAFGFVLTQTMRVGLTLTPTFSIVRVLTQNLTASLSSTPKFIWGRVLNQAFITADTPDAAGTYKRVLTQVFNLAHSLGFRLPVILTQSMSLSSSQAIAASLQLLQKVLVASTQLPFLTYHLSLASRLITSDLLGHFVTVIMTQLFNMHAAAPTYQFVTSNTLAQLLTIHPAFNNKLVLQIVGNIQLSPSQLIQALYRGDELLDGVTITALYVSPTGTTTTWAVNTRTNAVTEYTNYNFRSFTPIGDRYIAAGVGGLYELDGDDDDGQAIIADMLSGYLQLNEKKLFGIKSAYVAIRGGGRFYLKLLSGDGREYIYELKSQPNMMTTKVKIGKGIRTAYMAFELITEGQDFDLDSLEFVPMTSGRRV